MTLSWALLSKAQLWVSRFISAWNVRMSSPYWMHWNRRKTFLQTLALQKQLHMRTPEPCSLTCGAWQAALGVWVKAAVLLGGEAPSSVCCCIKGCFVGLVFFLLLPGEILFSFLPCLKSVEMDNCIVHVAVPALRDFWLGYAVSQSTSLTVVKKMIWGACSCSVTAGQPLVQGFGYPSKML